MKTTKKILSIFVAAVMVFTMIPLTAFAEDRTAEQFISNDNLVVLADRLIKDIDSRKDQDIGTILRLVFMFVDDASLKDAVGETNLYSASDEQLADILVNWLNANLPEWTKDIPDIANTLIKTVAGKDANLKTVDGVMETLVGVCDSGLIKKAGDLKNLDGSALKKGKNAITVKNGAKNIDIVKALISWLASDGQIKIINKLLMGKLTLGKILTFDLDKEVGIDKINNTMKNLPSTIKGIIYDKLAPLKDAEGNKIAYADSDYYKEGYTADELLACALINLLKDGKVDKAEANAAAGMTFYELLDKYAGDAITKYALDPINGQFKNWLKNDVVTDPNFAFLKDMINWDFEVKVDTFNLDGIAKDGIFSKVNTILVGFCQEVFTKEAVAEMKLVDGGNDKLQANLENAIRCILSKVPDNFQGYDFASIKANLDKYSLNELVVRILDLFFPQWFGTNAPAEVTTLGQTAGWAAYTAINKFVMNNKDNKYADFKANFDTYKSLVFDNNGKVYTNLSDDEWIDRVLTMGVDVGVYALNKNSASTYFVLTPEQVTEYKKAGWTWRDFLDEVADWGINFIKGLPAIADELSANRGKTDTFGAFYKVNVVLNDLLPLSFLNGCAGGTIFDADTETLVIEKLLKSILKFDISGVVDVLNVNNNEGNPFNKPLISSVLDMVENLVFSLFEYDSTLDGKDITVPSTKDKEGYKYQTGKNDKFYRITEVLPAGGDDKPTEKPTEKPTKPTTEKPTEAPTEKPTEAPTDKPTEKPSETTTEAPSTVKLGDLDGNGKIAAKDARLALRISAKLEKATDDQIKAGDLNGDGKVTAKEARSILRVSAKLDNEAALDQRKK